MQLPRPQTVLVSRTANPTMIVSNTSISSQKTLHGFTHVSTVDLIARRDGVTSRAAALSSLLRHVATFRHSATGLVVVVCPAATPLTMLNIVVPTIVPDNRGLPHTLEHLVFCGSLEHPHRGFLDNLATRCLSNGTNAYTADDHTAYTLTTAGSHGMLRALPVFVDHVFRPTLREAQFITEVFHVDGEAKLQGVVYSEMAGREDTEADVHDRAVRTLIYGPNSSLSRECGGRTTDIPNLTNDAIKAYHSQFYQLHNAAVIVSGDVDVDSLLLALDPLLVSIRDSLSNSSTENNSVFDYNAHYKGINESLNQVKDGMIRESVEFASSDEDVGSISYAWRGPCVTDSETVLALEILFRFLVDTPASPFPRKFVECENPLASQVDFEYRLLFETFFMLEFSGVPFHTKVESNSSSNTVNMFDDGVYSKLVMDLLLEIFNDNDDSSTNGLTLRGIHDTLTRQKRKLIETLEEDPLEVASGLIVTDYLANFYSEKYLDNHPTTSTAIGTRLDLATMLENLFSKPLDYWKALFDEYLLHNKSMPCVELKMTPSVKLAEVQAMNKEADFKNRVKTMGEDGMKAAGERSKWAIEENKVNLPTDLLLTLPSVPLPSEMSRREFELSYWDLCPKQEEEGSTNQDLKSLPFEFCHALEIDTSFLSVRFAMDARGIPEHLAIYIPLMQELIFQTRTLIPNYDVLANDHDKPLDITFEELSYEEVSNKAVGMFARNEASLGLGNEIWTCSYMSEIFQIFGSVLLNPSDTHDKLHDEWTKMVRFLVRCLIWAEFDTKRIVSTAKNQLSEITELKRGGYEMISAVSTRITHPRFGNDNMISIFKQEEHLRQVIRDCKAGNDATIRENLRELKHWLLFDGNPALTDVSQSKRIHAGFLQISCPSDYKHLEKVSVIVAQARNIWESEALLYQWYFDHKRLSSVTSDDIVVNFSIDSHKANLLRRCLLVGDENSYDWVRKMNIPSGFTCSFEKRKQDLMTFNSTIAADKCSGRLPFPFERTPFSIINAHKAFIESEINDEMPVDKKCDIMVPIKGIGSSYMSQIVECNVLSDPSSLDYWSIRILAEILSVTEGPLYTRVRGKGYAYGASMQVVLWAGQLSFDVYECSDLAGAINEFYSIINEMKDKKTFISKYCNEVSISTAKASILYRAVSDRSTANGVRSVLLNGSLSGFLTAESDIEKQSSMVHVEVDDLYRVFNTYLLRFLDVSRRVTICIVPQRSSNGNNSNENDDDDEDYMDDDDSENHDNEDDESMDEHEDTLDEDAQNVIESMDLIDSSALVPASLIDFKVMALKDLVL